VNRPQRKKEILPNRHFVWKQIAYCLMVALAVWLPRVSESAQGQDAPTMSVDVKVVTLPVTVRDKHGQLVRNLTRDDFVLEEDGHPQTIRYFSQKANLPLTLGLLVDTSLSQG